MSVRCAAQRRHYASPDGKDSDQWGQTFDIYAPYETLLNDIVYTDYHKFGAEARMLPGFDVVPDATASPAGNGQSPTKPPPNR